MSTKQPEITQVREINIASGMSMPLTPRTGLLCYSKKSSVEVCSCFTLYNFQEPDSMNRREGENREAEAVQRAWLLLADPDFLDVRQILVKLPYDWKGQSEGLRTFLDESGSRVGSGGLWSFSTVMSDQPAQYADGNDLAAGVFVGFNLWVRVGDTLESLMTPRTVKITEIFCESPSQVVFIPKNKMIQQFGSDRFNHAFAKSIRFRRAVGNRQPFYAHDVVQPFIQMTAKFAAFSVGSSPYHSGSPYGLSIAIHHDAFSSSPTLVVLAKYLVVVVDQIFGVNLPGRHLPELLLDEIQRGVGGNTEAHDLAGLQMHDHEDVDNLKVGQVLGEEVAAQHPLLMFRQEGPPRLAGVGSPVPGDVLFDGHRGMLDTQLEPHLVGDVLGAPGGVVHGQLADDGDIRFGNGRATGLTLSVPRPALELPVLLKKRTVPSHDRVWLNNHQSRSPTTPDLAENSPEEPVHGAAADLLAARLLQLGQELENLLAKGGVLKAQGRRGLETGPEDCGQPRQAADQAQKGVEGHRETSQGSEISRVTILHGLPDEGARKPLKCPLGVTKMRGRTRQNGGQSGPRPARRNFKNPLQNSLGYIYCGAWQSTRTAKTGGPPPDVPARLSQTQRKAA